jgi:DNA-binding SARP family transcriptional activator
MVAYTAISTSSARSLERLGQLYDEQGDRTKAVEYYARFAELWKDADPELQPRVQAAQARLDEILAERG